MPGGYGRNKATTAATVFFSKYHQQQQQHFSLSFSFCFFSLLFSSLLLSWVMVGLWLGFRALPEGVSEVLVFEKTSFFQPMFFVGFSQFLREFFREFFTFQLWMFSLGKSSFCCVEK
ncbi:hypothetical protein [Bacteroides faecium]|uniref:Transmembrane protein n=1 Tax=Bacteroides faecium TaxID=2715212 RepID=A0A6H0KSX1_9BACE|nr:hypothetical protein [Bacteroides faecium]QIU96564.1 hypothetical protein BacF7301_21475 [Bacteroides faecium]